MYTKKYCLLQIIPNSALASSNRNMRNGNTIYCNLFAVEKLHCFNSLLSFPVKLLWLSSFPSALNKIFFLDAGVGHVLIRKSVITMKH